ncbi:MAG: type II toxin-antitoxin system RelE/ParE family toxin [Kiritimatiellaeota bacterium]|nr:type II toxin-antitoxin system RelE/ParE family toxin [Kiritimatiellota bacterium]
MTYRVGITETAKRELEKLDPPLQRRLRTAMTALAENPRPPGAIMLHGEREHWRIRVGDWRIIYTIEDDRLMVIVLQLGHRREIYR